MNPYDEPTSRRARTPQPSWDDEYPGARDYSEADRSHSATGRASVGRASVRRVLPEQGGPTGYDGPIGYDAGNGYGNGYGADPYAPPISPGTGRASVGRATVRPI